MASLFDPVSLGALQLKNRVVMAPMTRGRAYQDGTPSSLAIDYYVQRADAGLIISEGVYPSEDGKGYCRTPGIINDKQQQAWQAITEAVKSQQGSMVMQLMHCGRVASAANKAEGSRTVAPSAIQADVQMYTDQGMLPCELPEALNAAEIPVVIEQYRMAAKRAIAAGFAGVELHCTSGYLPAQFLSAATNQRDDEWGGSIANRIRFVLKTLEVLIAVAGADRVGMRICPGNPFNDLADPEPVETFTALLKEASQLGLAYLHVIRSPDTAIDSFKLARDCFSGPLIVNDGFDAESANAIIAEGHAAAVSFGRPFIANPDLVARMKNGWPLAEINMKTIYTPGAEGYSDYPLYTP